MAEDTRAADERWPLPLAKRNGFSVARQSGSRLVELKLAEADPNGIRVGRRAGHAVVV
jgi:hypothetical protein